MKITLSKIRQHHPCKSSWNKLLNSLGKTEADDTEVTIRYILDLLGFADATWALSITEGCEKNIRLFACDCAESVLPLFEEKYPEDKRPRRAIEVARRFAVGEATLEELKEVTIAAREAWWQGAEGSAVARAAWLASVGGTAWIVAVKARKTSAKPVNRAAAENEELKKQEEFLLKYI
jgi:hypothetical protein